MKHIILSVTTLLILHKACYVNSFSASVPPLKSVCTNMLPHHDVYKPQSSEAPFEITLSSSEVSGGEDVIVTLKSTGNTKFKGFYLQGRNEDSKPIGSFANNESAKTHSCGGIRGNSAHHASGKVEKTEVQVTWTAPKNYRGEVIFFATFVKDYVTIWSGVYSEAVLVTPAVEKKRGNLVNEVLSQFGINIPPGSK